MANRRCETSFALQRVAPTRTGQPASLLEVSVSSHRKS